MLTAQNKKRVIGLLLFAVILGLFLWFNRLPKLDIVGDDLDAASGLQCFQGFCIEKDPGTSFWTQWGSFSVTYLKLIALGMTFAFLVAGLAEAFIFPSGVGRLFASGSMFKRTIGGLAAGPVLNLCSACIVPVSSAYQRRGGNIEGAIAMVQGSATMNIPALVMAFSVFTPLLGLSRLSLGILGGLLLGPIVVKIAGGARSGPMIETGPVQTEGKGNDNAPWGPVLSEAFREWAKSSIGYLIRLGPIMVIAGFASGLAIQWLSPETVRDYLGNDVEGIAIAATVGILINVPLLFEIPLVALLLLLGMGTAPAATLLFAAAAGGPITFWGLAKAMPKKAVAAFAAGTWALGAIGGLSVLGVGMFIWDDNFPVKAGKLQQSANAVAEPTAPITEPLFLDITDRAGVNFLHQKTATDVLEVGGGALAFDFNNDGLHDIYVTNSEEPNALYRNNGDGTFTDVARKAGVDDALGKGNGGCAADYDNDGHVDLYLTNFGPSRLFKNKGDGTFSDVTLTAGVADSESNKRSTGCAWGDFDQDGFVDLVIVRHMNATVYYPQRHKDYLQAADALSLYHNNANGTFKDVTFLLGNTSGPRKTHNLGNLWGAAFQPAWFDFDNDGDLDLYIVNDFGNEVQPNVLWRNDGRGSPAFWKFVDVSMGSNANVPMYGMGLAVGDFDLDGFLDLYMTNIGHNVLLKNNGDGKTFTNYTAQANLLGGLVGQMTRVSWATVPFDYDNDGDEDLYVVSGFLGRGESLEHQKAINNPIEQPNLLVRNNGDGTFISVSRGSGADDPGVGRGGLYLDYNNDGCLDLFITNLRQAAKLFRNVCDSGNSWLIIKPVGTSSNRDGIGARITVVAGGKTQIREIAAGANSMGQNMVEAHFGLAQVKTVDSITIRWPSGKVQTLAGAPVNQKLTITEPSAGP